MLVLLRRIGEEIQIGSAINVRVLTVSKHRVKLGVSGPGEVSVMRGDMRRRSIRHAGTASDVAL